MQRLLESENREPESMQYTDASQQQRCDSDLHGMTVLAMPQLRHRGLPHAPVSKRGSYNNGPCNLRVKAMSVGNPPPATMVSKHDSLALSVWAAAGQKKQ